MLAGRTTLRPTHPRCTSHAPICSTLAEGLQHPRQHSSRHSQQKGGHLRPARAATPGHHLRRPRRNPRPRNQALDVSRPDHRDTPKTRLLGPASERTGGPTPPHPPQEEEIRGVNLHPANNGTTKPHTQRQCPTAKPTNHRPTCPTEIRTDVQTPKPVRGMGGRQEAAGTPGQQKPGQQEMISILYIALPQLYCLNTFIIIYYSTT